LIWFVSRHIASPTLRRQLEAKASDPLKPNRTDFDRLFSPSFLRFVSGLSHSRQKSVIIVAQFPVRRIFRRTSNAIGGWFGVVNFCARVGSSGNGSTNDANRGRAM